MESENPKTRAVWIIGGILALVLAVALLAPIIGIILSLGFGGTVRNLTGGSAPTATVTSVSSGDLIGIMGFLVTLISLLAATIGIVGYLYMKQRLEAQIAVATDQATAGVRRQLDCQTAIYEKDQQDLKRDIAWTSRFLAYDYWTRFEQEWVNEAGNLDAVRRNSPYEELLKRAAQAAKTAYVLYVSLPEALFRRYILETANDAAYYMATLGSPEDRKLTLELAGKLYEEGIENVAFWDTTAWAYLRYNAPDINDRDPTQWEEGLRIYKEKVLPRLLDDRRSKLEARYNWLFSQGR